MSSASSKPATKAEGQPAAANDAVAETARRSTEHAQPDDIEAIALFSGLGDATLALLASRMKLVWVEPGEIVFSQGDCGRAMYVVLEGAVALGIRGETGSKRCLAVASAGDWFGEMAVLDVMARPATATATERAKLLTICPTDLNAVYRADVRNYAILVMNLARQLSRKLRAAADVIAGEE